MFATRYFPTRYFPRRYFDIGNQGINPAVIWNPLDYDNTNLTLSADKLTITANNVGAGGNFYASARSTVPRSTGKFYFELKFIVTPNSTNSRVGIGNSTAPISGTIVGGTADSIGYTFGDGTVVTNNGSLGTAATSIVGQIIGVAIDITNSRIWFRINSSPFFKNGVAIDITQTTPTDWFSFSGVVGSIMAMVNTLTTNDQLVANFGATAFTASIPQGFTSWDGNQTFNNQLFVQTVTWNPNDKSGNVSLTNGNLTATATTGDGTNQNVRCSLGRNAGRFYFEITEPTASHSIESSGYGWANPTESLVSSYAGQTNNSTGYYKSEGVTGEVFLNNALVDTAGPAVLVLPQTWGIAVDFDLKKWWIRVGTGAFIKGGVSIDITVANPVDGFPLTALGTGMLYPFLNLAWTDTWTANFGATAFITALPTGYTSWDGSQAAITVTLATNRNNITVTGKFTSVSFAGGGGSDERFTKDETPDVRIARDALKLKRARQSLGIIPPDPIAIPPRPPLAPATGIMGRTFDDIALGNRLEQMQLFPPPVHAEEEMEALLLLL